ncbi:FadR/GntR family transcriptional regulator [Pedobacter antarcticus]|uniref:FadR/GntR family transcriptional regulator n=1 Tax=Pedobacter antarcticus TaxID=34086 RepID=UPI0039774EAC
MNEIIVRTTLCELVAVKLRDQIRCGYYKMDQKIPVENELTKIFGVGRSTIREAVCILKSEGILRVHQGAGTFVSGIPIRTGNC